MNNNIEQLKTEVDDIKNSLNELKNNVSLSESEKKIQADALKTKAETTRQKIENEIKALETATDSASKKKKEEAEALLNSLTDITNLYNSIINPTSAPTSTPVQAAATEEKNIFGKAKVWIGDQWDAIWDGSKWERSAEGGKNLLRVVGFGVTGFGALALTYKGVKKLWNWAFSSDDKKDKDTEESESKSKKKKKEKKPFWDRPFGRFLKRTGIGTGIVGGTYGILRWLGIIGKSDNVDGSSSDKDKLNGYEEEIVKNPENKEKFENYEAFGENIDILYGNIYSRELSAGYQDELEMQKIASKESNGEKHYKGIVPYCLDNHFKNVENILGQNSSMKEAVSKGLDGMINYVKGKGNDFLQMFVDTYLSVLPSWLPFKNIAGSLSDKIDQWKIKNENAKEEMQYFFRQSIRVQTYLFEKKDHLIEKIVKRSSVKYGISEKDILGSDENFKKYVLNEQDYQNFINSPISSAVTILKNNDIFDSDIRKKMEENVKELDNQRNEVLGCKENEKDILEIINDKKEKGEALTGGETKALEKACDGIVKDVDNNIMEAVEESAWSIYGDFRGSEDSHLREYLDKSGLEKVFREYKQIILQKKLELHEGKLSNEDKIALSESINDMLALKKEAVSGSQTIEKDYDENGNIVYRIPGFLVGSISNLCKSVGKLRHGEFLSGINYMTSAGLGTGLVITSAGVIYGIKTGKWGVTKIGAKITVLPAGVIYEGLTMIKKVRDGVDKINYPFKFWGEKGPKKLMDLLKDGKISLNKASEIAKGKTLAAIGSRNVERRRKDFLGITNNNENVMYKVFDKLVTETSNTAAGSTYLQSIKDDNELYETLVKNYDSSKEIRQAISQNVPLDELKRVAEQSTVPEVIRNNLNYKKIINDLYLEEKRLKTINSNAAKHRLSNVSEFKKALITMDVKEIESAAELLSEFKKGGTIGDAIDQLNFLRKLEGKILDTGFLDSSGKSIKQNLDDIIKNMDFAELRRCKGKGLGISDDEIESLAKTFEKIHASRVLNFSDNIDEIGKIVKTMVKILTKTT